MWKSLPICLSATNPHDSYLLSKTNTFNESSRSGASATMAHACPVRHTPNPVDAPRNRQSTQRRIPNISLATASAQGAYNACASAANSTSTSNGAGNLLFGGGAQDQHNSNSNGDWASQTEIPALEARRKADKTRKRVLWSQDGSLGILVSWLTEEDNYSRYFGGGGGEE
eukprot:IDg11860t1